MHILATTSSSPDDLAEPVDLDQPPGDVVVLSFSGSDLASISAAWAKGGDTMPSLRLAELADLRHPMSVDLWIDKTASKARIILVRVLGGFDRWRYGIEQLADMARARGVQLALLPGECSQRDERMIAASTIAPEKLASLLSCFREGGAENMRLLSQHLAALATGSDTALPAAATVPKAGFYKPGAGMVALPELLEGCAADAAVLPVLFYRSMLLANDVAPIDALYAALKQRGFAPVPIFVSGLKDAQALSFAEDAFATLKPSAIIAATAFASGADENATTIFDRTGVTVFQVIIATTKHEGWEGSKRGLNPSDLAMHVVLPELDGRILAGAISFKQTGPGGTLINVPQADRIEQVASRISAFLRLKNTATAERNITILIPDYPGAPGRTGYAVGLDVPQSVLCMLHDLADSGYSAGDIPQTPRHLLDLLLDGGGTLSLGDYQRGFNALPQNAHDAMIAAWGVADGDEALDNTGHFRFRAARFGNITVALAPDRGRNADRRADYHDPTLPPRHALLAFGQWMRESLDTHAIVHVGAHGTLEWLPGKTVALSQDCFPEIVTGPIPVIYPFIVSNPGEAAVAKRRISAVTIGHLPPALDDAGLSPDQQKLEQLVDEYAQADGLDRRRRDRLAALIVETAASTGLATEAGVGLSDDPDTALSRIDAFLCDLKDFALRDGQHIFGRSAPDEQNPLRLASVAAEKQAFLKALDGQHIRPGPSGAPSRGRQDVMPTGRNLYAADPRTMPTPTAFELGKRAAEEVLRSYLQNHGDWPRNLVIDLWGSASLRNGGEDIAQIFALIGAKPVYDTATGRVTGVEIIPPASLGRPRIDVTCRISGLFRDMFPALIALLDTAMRAIAAREEAPGDNPLSEEAARTGQVPARIFGSAPGTYGAGIEEALSSGAWAGREDLGQAYLDFTSHTFGGLEGEDTKAQGQFAGRVLAADLLVHTGDDPGRDLLDGSSDVAFIGGFAAAVASLGGKADIIALDTTDPARPRARSVAQAITRIVRARAVNPRFIAGQMRHGPRGAAEFVETVDRLIGFAETTQAIPHSLIEAVYDAYLGNAEVRDFLIAQNPEGAAYMAERFISARKRGLWKSLRNSLDHDLENLQAALRKKEAV